MIKEHVSHTIFLEIMEPINKKSYFQCLVNVRTVNPGHCYPSLGNSVGEISKLLGVHFCCCYYEGLPPPLLDLYLFYIMENVTGVAGTLRGGRNTQNSQGERIRIGNCDVEISLAEHPRHCFWVQRPFFLFWRTIN